MADFTNTLIQTFVLDECGKPPCHYECSPFSSHTILQSKRITRATGGGRINVVPIKWIDEDQLNRAIVRMYERAARDEHNEVDHETVLAYLRKNPCFFGPETEGPRAQIVCQPGDAKWLAETWAFLNPTVYAAEHMGRDSTRNRLYYMLPSPEVLGVAPVCEGRYGLFVRESRRVLEIRF